MEEGKGNAGCRCQANWLMKRAWKRTQKNGTLEWRKNWNVLGRNLRREKVAQSHVEVHSEVEEGGRNTERCVKGDRWGGWMMIIQSPVMYVVVPSKKKKKWRLIHPKVSHRFAAGESDPRGGSWRCSKQTLYIINLSERNPSIQTYNKRQQLKGGPTTQQHSPPIAATPIGTKRGDAKRHNCEFLLARVFSSSSGLAQMERKKNII